MAVNLVTGRLVEKQVQQVKEAIQHELSLIRYSIEANVFRDTYLADSFTSVVALNPQFAIDNWQYVAGQFLAKAGLVRNISLAPNDIIAYVYPIEGNEKAVGLDFRTVPNQYKTVQIARETKKVFVAGPLELVQGGTALIARYPIFTDAPRNTEYWGGLSVVISYDRLIEISNLHHLKSADIALVSNNFNGTEQKLIEGNPAVVDEADISYPISLPNGNWTLFAKYKNINDLDSISKFENLYNTLGLITFLVGYFLVLFLINSYFRAHKLSLHDELTKLPNRRYLFNEFERIQSKKGAFVEFAVLNIDLNRFKKINDSLGHEAGDEVLKYTAESLTKCLRTSDFISRIGGDEFVVILQRTSKVEDIEQLIHKIHLYLESSPLHWNEHKIWLSLSIGYYVYQGQTDDLIIHDILSEADKSMYQDKLSRRHKNDTSAVEP